MIGVALLLGLMVACLTLVAAVRVRATVSVLTWAVGGLERSTQRIGVLAVVAGAGSGGWLIGHGLDVVTALIIAMLAAFGMLCLTLAILGMEGLLTESGLDRRLRIQSGGAPPSTALGRSVAGLIGTAAVALTLIAIHLVG